MTKWAIKRADDLLHVLLDPYVNRQLPGWGRLQLWLWRYLCQPSER